MDRQQILEDLKEWLGAYEGRLYPDAVLIKIEELEVEYE